jgi:hypothetical protein
MNDSHSSSDVTRKAESLLPSVPGLTLALLVGSSRAGFPYSLFYLKSEAIAVSATLWVSDAGKCPKI